MSVIKLLKNINLDIEYENTIDFDSLSSQYSYFNNQVASGDTFNDVLFIRNTAERVFGIFGNANTKMNFDVKLVMDIDEARKYNYCMFQNDGDTKWYYGFIISTTYINKEVTEFSIALDVFQSFLFDFTLESAYIDREHQDRWYSNFTPKYNVQEESLNCGEEYNITDIKKMYTYDDGTYQLVWCMLVWKIPFYFDAHTPIDTIMPSQFGPSKTLYVSYHPYIKGMIQTEGYYKVQIDMGSGTPQIISTINEIMPYVYSNENLEAVYVVPYCPYLNDTNTSYTFDDQTRTLLIETAKTNYSVEKYNYGLTPEILSKDVNRWGLFLRYNDETNMEEILRYTIETPTIPIALRPSVDNTGQVEQTPISTYESKLNVYPYRSIQMQFNNNIKDYRFEYISANTVKMRCLYYDIPILQITITNYNGDTTMNREGLIDRTINEICLVSDPYLNYWRQNKAQIITGLATTIGAMAVSAVAGGIAGASAGMAGVSLPAVVNGASVTYSNLYVAQQMATAGVKGFAKGAMPAVVNGSVGVGSMLAKLHDLKGIPSSIRALGNNGTLATMSECLVPTLYYLEIKPQFKEKIYNYFKLYGYRSLRFTYDGDNVGLNLRSRYYYNFIKCSDVKLHSTFNKLYTNQLEEILKKGITIWHKRDSITNFKMFKYDKENWEVSLL